MSTERSLNEVRNQLLSAEDYPEKKVLNKDVMSKTIKMLMDKFNLNDDKDLDEIFDKLGITLGLKKATSESYIENKEDEVIFWLGEDSHSSAEKDVLDLFGLYLFSSLYSPNTEIVYLTNLDSETRDMLNKFNILWKDPNLDFSEYLSIYELIELSVDLDIPLQSLRKAFSI